MLVDGFCYGCRDIEKRAKATIGSPNFLPLSRRCRGPCRTAPSFWGWRHDRSPRSGCVSRFRLSAHFLGEAARSGCCRLEESPARSACDFYQQWLLPWKVVSGSGAGSQLRFHYTRVIPSSNDTNLCPLVFLDRVLASPKTWPSTRFVREPELVGP